MTDTPPDGDVTELDEIVVIGTRPQPGIPHWPVEEQQEVDPNPDPGGGGGGLWTQPEVDAENERQKQCAAKKFADGLSEEDDKDNKEFFSFSWILNGQTVTHAIRGGAGVTITQNDLNPALSQFGINASQIVGFNHNHPSNHYCASGGLQGQDEIRRNSYPSDNDWALADQLVNLGADPNVLSLFVVGCDDQMREFRYRDRADAKRAADRLDPPPPPVQPEGCPE